MTRADASRSPSPSCCVEIAGTCTTEGIADVVAFWLKEHGLEPEVDVVPYGQVLEHLARADAWSDRPAHRVLLVRVADLVREDSTVDGGALARAQAWTSELLRLLRATPRRFVVPVRLPERELEAGDERASALRRARDDLVAALEALDNVDAVDCAHLADVYGVDEVFDPVTDASAHLPYTGAYSAALATLVTRRVVAGYTEPCKVIAVDGDNTLWRGVCAEVGPEAVELDESALALQSFLARQAEHGTLICLCSKNAVADANAVFDHHRDAPLRPGMIVAQRVNWAPKSANLRELAAELGLSLRSFVVVDDDPVECAEIRAGCPDVRVLELPAQDVRRFLERSWAFDRALPSTAEDRLRAHSYRAERERRAQRARAGSFEQFLRDLDLRVNFAPVDESRVDRASQLTLRTNQMNFTGVRWTAEELHALRRDEATDLVAVDVEDRFGRYGFVGLIAASTRAGVLEVRAFILSCRVLGRRVEHAMLDRVAALAETRGAQRVHLVCAPTDRNVPAQQLVREIMGREGGDATAGGEISVERLRRLSQPGRRRPTRAARATGVRS